VAEKLFQIRVRQIGASHISASRTLKGFEKEISSYFGAGYTSDFVCDFMSDLLQIADAILLYLRFGVTYRIATVYT
jgi:hypothetical protein